MTLAIMQPYFLPYIGYFQLMAAADVFVLYDNIKYTKKGWINRNRLLRNGGPAVFSLPLEHGSDALDIRERRLAASFQRERLLLQFKEAYRRAPHFASVFPLLETMVRCGEINLFCYLQHSLVCVCNWLGLETEVRVSSTVPIDHSLRGQDKVLAICSALGAATYLNAPGGRALYAREAFAAREVDLAFIEPRPHVYEQGGSPFVPWLSIADVLMFNGREGTRRLLEEYDVVRG